MITLLISFAVIVLALLFGKKAAENSGFVASSLPEPVRRWKDEIKAASQETGVPQKYIAAIIWQESGGDPNAIGSAGEIGLMQLKAMAADDVQNILGQPVGNWKYEPADNIRTGAGYLRLQRKRAGNWPDAIRAYNQGFAGMDQSQEKINLSYKYLNEVTEKLKQIG